MQQFAVSDGLGYVLDLDLEICRLPGQTEGARKVKVYNL